MTATLLLTLTVPATVLPARQYGGAWALQPGWQVVQDHPGNPDLFVVGLYGEPYVDPNWRPPPTNKTRQARQRTDRLILSSGRMPRLALRCEEGVTSLIVLRPTAAALGTGQPPLGNRRTQATAAGGGEGKLALQLDDEDPIEIELRAYDRAIDPVYLPDPFDTIGRVRRHRVLHYFELVAGKTLWLDYGSPGWTAGVDAVLPLEGLDELLRATRDPCSWRSS
jgi:hypothetical protein